MPESILVVDSDATNLRFLKLVLTADGFEVKTASRAAEALAVLASFRPSLILTGASLPDATPPDFIRSIHAVSRLRTIPIVLVSANTDSALRDAVLDAGCAALLPKPVDVRTLRSTVSGLIASASEGHEFGAELAEIRRDFATEGLAHLRSLSASPDPDPVVLARLAHNWKGAGTTVGAARISELAGELQTAGGAAIPAILNSLGREFEAILDVESQTHVLPDAVIAALRDKKIGLIGFIPSDEVRLRRVFDAAGAFCRVLDCFNSPPGSPESNALDLLLFDARPETAASLWMDATALTENAKPLIITGSPEALFSHGSPLRDRAADFIARPWTELEAACRAGRALEPSRTPSAPCPGTESRERKTNPTILLADDDATIRSLLLSTLRNSRMTCHPVEDGRSALEAVRRIVPDAAILDVNMPNSDGFEVLSAIRADPKTRNVRVILLTARQQETDVLRGFRLGADDYLVKPFSPMELVARLERVLAR